MPANRPPPDAARFRLALIVFLSILGGSLFGNFGTLGTRLAAACMLAVVALAIWNLVAPIGRGSPPGARLRGGEPLVGSRRLRTLIATAIWEYQQFPGTYVEAAADRGPGQSPGMPSLMLAIAEGEAEKILAAMALADLWPRDFSGQEQAANLQVAREGREPPASRSFVKP